MPLSELVKKWEGLTFDIAAEEIRRLAGAPTDEEKFVLYGLYKQAIHGDIPSLDLYPRPDEGTVELRKYLAWEGRKGLHKEAAKAAYVHEAEEMIKKYSRSIVRSKWNSQVWSVDY